MSKPSKYEMALLVVTDYLNNLRHEELVEMVIKEMGEAKVIAEAEQIEDDLTEGADHEQA